MTLPTDPKERKATPIFTGVLMYFPLTMAGLARVSAAGNEQHHPGTPLHWDRAKSSDDHDACVRHMMQTGTIDSDGIPHDLKTAWRACAISEKFLERLQREAEAQGKREAYTEHLMGPWGRRP